MKVKFKEEKHHPRCHMTPCKVSIKEKNEIKAAAKAAGISASDLTRECTLHIIREGSLEVRTEIRIATSKEDN